MISFCLLFITPEAALEDFTVSTSTVYIILAGYKFDRWLNTLSLAPYATAYVILVLS